MFSFTRDARIEAGRKNLLQQEGARSDLRMNFQLTKVEIQVQDYLYYYFLWDSLPLSLFPQAALAPVLGWWLLFLWVSIWAQDWWIRMRTPTYIEIHSDTHTQTYKLTHTSEKFSWCSLLSGSWRHPVETRATEPPLWENTDEK